MKKISVSVVAYANSLPFVYGLLHSDFSKKIDVQIDMPAVCADKLLKGSVDISLVPVAEMLRLHEFYRISDLCIGAKDYVKTVILASDCPLSEIEEIYLDYQSRTSVVLVKVLAENFWKIKPTWIPAKPGYEKEVIKNKSGAVIIGDRTFSVNAKHIYDLSHEWNIYTQLPFVFAAWLTKKSLPPEFINEFNHALQYGVEHIHEAVKTYNQTPLSNSEICDYLQNNISYQFDSTKSHALELFLQYASKITG